MGFFLIGRGAHDDVRLLTDSVFATRQDAMAELSRLSAQPEYDAWDADVFVADLDAAAPVLLVRSQAAPSVEAPAAVEDGAGGAQDVEVSENQGTLDTVEAAAHPEGEVQTAEDIVAEPAIAETTLADIAAAGPTGLEPVDVQPDIAEPAESEPAVVEGETPEAPSPFAGIPASAGIAAGALASGGAVVAGFAAHAAQGSASEAAAAPAAGGQDDLREAILRTTQHMTAEGVEPPASAGLASTRPEEPLEVAEPVAADTPATDAIDQSPSEAASVTEPPAAVDGEPETPAWPWADLNASQVADEAAGIAEPSADETAPVAEPPQAVAEATAPVSQGGGDAAAAQDSPGTPGSTPREPMSSIMAAATTPWTVQEPSDQAEEPTPESDFILDLEEIQPVQLESHEAGLASESALQSAAVPQVEPATTSAVTSATTHETEPPAQLGASSNPSAVQDTSASTGSLLTEYTCEDCVYVGTCPNRDQRLPKDCGSFQWR